MRLGWAGALVVGGLGLTMGGAAAYVDSVGGPGTARSAVNFGVGQTAGMAGEAAGVVPAVIEEVKPALNKTMGQAGDVLGTQGTVPPARTDLTEPSEQGGAP